MKRKIVCGIVLCLAFVLAGCGNSKEKQAANYYQKELGLDKEEAEELAKELYGDDDDTDIAGEDPGKIVVEPLPELVNSEWYDCKIQIYDMVFCNDFSMTENDIRAAAEGSAYNVELSEGFDDNGNVCITSLAVDGIVVNFYHGSNSEDFKYFVEYGLLDDEDYYLVYTWTYTENSYDKPSMELENLETRDGVLAYLSENGFVEVEEAQAFYYNNYGNSIEQKDAEFADTPHYLVNGAQSIHIYSMRKISETDQDIQSYFLHYSGGHLNLVEHVLIDFNTDGTIRAVQRQEARRYLILGEQIG